ncbi:cell division protein FtsQ [Spirochaetia bacterium]|nr:cell division protein FtsQ [Spirochaetia bacterium]
MSSDYLYADDPAPIVDRGIERGETTRTHSKMDKWLIRFIILIACILGAELVWLFGITPLMPLSVVEVGGIPGIEKSSLLAQAGIGAHSSYLSVNTAAAEKTLESLYQIESAHVIKHYPDTVQIYLEPRHPAALSLAQVEGKTLPVFLDKHGVVIRIGGESPELASSSSLPIISGLVFEELVPGMKLPVMFESFFSRLEWLNASSPELLAAVSEIRINRKAYNGFDLVLYPVNSTIKFRVEAELNEDALRYMILMIDVLGRTGLDVDEVDLRSGTASYAVKEALSG